MQRKPAERFQDLVVWQKAHQLVLSIYKVTRDYPRAEIFGLTSQMRRAAVSVPANIAEGFKKRGQADKARLLNIAEASLEELRYYLILSRELGYLSGNTGEIESADEVARILGGYVRTVLSGIAR
jgi:four helix bundle protein